MINGVQLGKGKVGWRARLREIYNTVESLEKYAHVLEKLGYESAQAAFDANPVLEGSDSEDGVRVVKQTPGPWRWWMEKVERGIMKGQQVRRALMGPGRGQFVMDAATIQMQGETDPEHVYLQINRDDEATVFNAPLLREALRQASRRFTELPTIGVLVADQKALLLLLKLAVDVADGVEDPDKLTEAICRLQ